MVEGRGWVGESQILQLVPVWLVLEPKGWVSVTLMIWHRPWHLTITNGHAVTCAEIMNRSRHLWDEIEVTSGRLKADFLVLGRQGVQSACDRSLEIEAEGAETVESMSDLTGQMEIVGQRTNEKKVSMDTRTSITRTYMIICFPLPPFDDISLRI